MSLAYNCCLVAYLLILLCCGVTKDPDSYIFVALCYLVVAALVAISSLDSSPTLADEVWANKTMPDLASIVAPDCGDLKNPGFEHQSLLPWAERSSASPDVLEGELDQKTRPNELDLLPDGEDTPYELVQIFKAAGSKDALRLWNSNDLQSQEVITQADTPQPEVESRSSLSSVTSNLSSGNDAICTPSTASLGSHEITHDETSEPESTISSSTRPRLRLLASTTNFLGSKIKHKRSSLARASSPKTIPPVTA